MAVIIRPGEIPGPATEPPFLRLPARDAVFARRAERLEGLAPGHSLQDYLLFIARLARAQQAALDDYRAPPLPTAQDMALCREHRLPPLSAQGWRRDPSWHDCIGRMLAAVAPAAPPATQAVIARLQRADPDALEAWAGALLEGDAARIDAAAAPLVGAALQVYWAAMATALPATDLGRIDPPNLCPVCGSPPVASVVRAGGPEQGLRYLICSLCATQWNLVRIKCSNCLSTQGIGYYQIEGGSAAIKAEACPQCQGYLKIMYLEHDPGVEPVADDLASLALDMLMEQSGFLRNGPNLYFVPGPEPPG